MTYYTAIQDAFQAAIQGPYPGQAGQGLESYFAAAAGGPLLIKIGETNKAPYVTTPTVDYIDYDTYLNELKNDETFNNSFISLGLRYDGSGPENPVNGDDYIGITYANEKALGYFPIDDSSDGTILLDPSQLYFPTGLSKTAAAAQTTQFQFTHLNAVDAIESQLLRIMGMDSGYNYPNLGFFEPEPEDLYRYTAPGVFATTGGQSAYFSLTGGAGGDADALDFFNTKQVTSTGAEYSDWLPGSENGSQFEDAGGIKGGLPTLPLSAEILMLDTLGWTPASLTLPAMSVTGTIPLSGDQTDDVKSDEADGNIWDLYQNDNVGNSLDGSGVVIAEGLYPFPSGVFPGPMVTGITATIGAYPNTELSVDMSYEDMDPTYGISFTGNTASTSTSSILNLFSGGYGTFSGFSSETETPTGTSSGEIQYSLGSGFPTPGAVTWTGASLVYDNTLVTGTATFNGLGSNNDFLVQRGGTRSLGHHRADQHQRRFRRPRVRQ